MQSSGEGSERICDAQLFQLTVTGVRAVGQESWVFSWVFLYMSNSARVRQNPLPLTSSVAGSASLQ
jgi:hypothetical protein